MGWWKVTVVAAVAVVAFFGHLSQRGPDIIGLLGRSSSRRASLSEESVGSNNDFLSKTANRLLQAAHETRSLVSAATTLCLSEAARQEVRRISKQEVLNAARAYLDLVYVAIQDGSPAQFSPFTPQWLQVVADSNAAFLYDTALTLFSGDPSACQDSIASQTARTLSASQAIFDYAVAMTGLLNVAVEDWETQSMGHALVIANPREEQAYFTLLDKLGIWWCALTRFVEDDLQLGKPAEQALPSFFGPFRTDVESLAAIAPGGTSVNVDALLDCKSGKGGKKGNSAFGGGKKRGMNRS